MPVPWAETLGMAHRRRSSSSDRSSRSRIVRSISLKSVNSRLLLSAQRARSLEGKRGQSMDSGDHANVSRIACSVHSGTHVDAPVHFVARGKGVESLPLKILTGRAYVLSLPRAKTLDAETLV